VPFSLGRLRAQLVYSLELGGPLGPLDVLLGLSGLVLAVRSLREHRQASLPALLLALWCSTLAALGTLLWTGQTVRWQAFLFPALAIGGGLSLHTLWRRKGVARSLAYGVLVLAILRGATLWYSQIATAYH